MAEKLHSLPKERSKSRISRNHNCDIKVIIGGETFNTHKALLQEHSTYFKYKCEGQRVVLEEVDLEGFKWCMEYMYTGKLATEEYGNEMSFELFEKVLKAADYLGMDEFKDKCQRRFCRNAGLSPEKGLDLVELLRKYGTARHVEWARKFAKTHLSVTIDHEQYVDIQEDDFFYYIEDSSALPRVIWDAVKLWIRHDKSRESCVDKVLDTFLSTPQDITAILLEMLQYSLAGERSQWTFRLLLHLEANSDAIIKKLNPELSMQFLSLAKRNTLPVDTLKKIREASIQCLAKAIGTSKAGYQDLDFEDLQKVMNSADDRVSKKVIWEAIVTWVDRDEARRRFLVALMKSLRLQRQDIQLIYEYITPHPIVKASPECLQYLLNLQQSPEQTHKPTSCNVEKKDQAMPINPLDENERSGLAILDDGRQELSIWDTTRNCNADVPLPVNRFNNTTRVASVSGDLFVQYGGTIAKLGRDGNWVTVFNDVKYTSTWVQFISLTNKLAILTISSTIIFDPESGASDFIEGCGLGTGFSSTGTGSYVFSVGGTFTATQAKRYVTDEKWINLPEMPVRVTEPATAYFQGKLYVIGGSGIFFRSSTVTYYDNGRWTAVSPMIKSRSKFAVLAYCNNLYVFGGTGGILQQEEQVEEFNT